MGCGLSKPKQLTPEQIERRYKVEEKVTGRPAPWRIVEDGSRPEQWCARKICKEDIRRAKMTGGVPSEATKNYAKMPTRDMRRREFSSSLGEHIKPFGVTPEPKFSLPRVR